MQKKNFLQPREGRDQTSDQAQTGDTSSSRGKGTIRDFSIHKPTCQYVCQQEKLKLSDVPTPEKGFLLGGMYSRDRAGSSGDDPNEKFARKVINRISDRNPSELKEVVNDTVRFVESTKLNKSGVAMELAKAFHGTIREKKFSSDKVNITCDIIKKLMDSATSAEKSGVALELVKVLDQSTRLGDELSRDVMCKTPAVIKELLNYMPQAEKTQVALGLVDVLKRCSMHLGDELRDMAKLIGDLGKGEKIVAEKLIKDVLSNEEAKQDALCCAADAIGKSSSIEIVPQLDKLLWEDHIQGKLEEKVRKAIKEIEAKCTEKDNSTVYDSTVDLSILSEEILLIDSEYNKEQPWYLRDCNAQEVEEELDRRRKERERYWGTD